MTAPTTILWFRNDLRLSANPALHFALQRGGAVVPVFIWAPEEEEPWSPGGASRWWLHRSLTALSDSLSQLGSRLIIRRGSSLKELSRLAAETGADAIVWNRRYEPQLAQRDAEIARHLSFQGTEVVHFPGNVLFEPGLIRNKSNQPFRVFTPFWKTCLAQKAEFEIAPKPKRLPPVAPELVSLPINALELEPKINWAAGFKSWMPGEAGATAALAKFIEAALSGYAEGRDRPDVQGTSRLSPHLHFGEVSVRTVWNVLQQAGKKAGNDTAIDRYKSELGWREFSIQLLHDFPSAPTEPIRPEFSRFAWNRDAAALKAWQRGQTGYPIVDAGMRQLWKTGWMHNRVRMITASFLIKDLLQPWQKGMEWFWDTLVDADLANNSIGWQWVTGCGADAAPFFRIFNPTTQGEKFDPNGDYVRRFVPELAALPSEWIHQPAAAPAEVLRRANVRLGENYPAPIVSHAIAREVALEKFRAIRVAS